MPRYLLGPTTAAFAERYLPGHRRRGDCLTFHHRPGADVRVPDDAAWADAAALLPDRWRPDYLALWLPGGQAPGWIWQAPIPVLGLAPEWDQRWHAGRHTLARCDLVFADGAGVAALRRAGVGHTRAAVLCGLPADVADAPVPEGERDIDVFFAGGPHPGLRPDLAAWLARLARLGERRRVVVAAPASPEEFRALLGRAKIAFARSARGGCEGPAFEAVAAGALLFQEGENRELAGHLRPGSEYIPYTDANLEALLEHYLVDEPLRRRIADAAHARVSGLSFERLWDKALAAAAAERAALVERAARRAASPPPADWVGRCWAARGAGEAVPGLVEAAGAAPSDAGLANAAGVLAPGPAEASAWFARALDADPGSVVAGLNRAEALLELGQREPAVAEARRALAALGRAAGLSPTDVRAPRRGRRLGLFDHEWERAGAANAGDAVSEAGAKARLLRWRLHSLVAAVTDNLDSFHQAALARPDLPTAAAALGCALARAGRLDEALPQLRAAVDADLFDLAAARALYQALGEAGSLREARALARDRWLLRRAAPGAVPAEDWFRERPPAGDELASVVVLCCNELDHTRLCLESVLRHTRTPYELVLVDNGSSDGTAAYLDDVRSRPGPARVEVIRNAENQGYAAGVNQGLSAARGEYLVLLNNDTVVTPGWLARLVDWSLTDFPRVGLVGAVSNYARPPQQVPPGYADLAGLDAFARRRGRDSAGRAAEAERLAGFCLLGRRELFSKVGALDEGFGLGFFEDDDLCVRARRAGYRLLVAPDVYVHHFGSRTFQALGIDTQAQLRANLERFRAKWGDGEAAGYRPAATPGDARPAAERPKVSACLIVRDEEHNLPDCLAGLRGLVDEVVVVDTGSKDRTREVAVAHGARVFELAWSDSFAAARNESLRHAAGEWVFWLDADDRVDEANRERLKALFASLGTENVGHVMKCLCVAGRPGGTATVVDHVRLFRNLPGHQWRYRVHEQILPALRDSGAEVRWSDVTIHHVGYADPALRRRKLERDLRLLGLERQEQPGDPFTLFNLGSAYQELGRHEESLDCLRESLARSHPRDSIVRKLYALIAQAQRRLGRAAEAAATCEAGRAHYPEDAELLFVEALARRETHDRPGAEACLLRLIEGREAEHFASVDAGLRGHKARHNLALLYLDQSRRHEAEAQWRACLVEEPSFMPARLGLGELYLRHKDWAALEGVAAELEAVGPEGAAEAEALRGRARMERGELASARWQLARASEAFPGHLGLRVLHSHAALREGADPAAAERALRGVLELDPDNPEARRNLGLLLADAPAPVTLDSLYRDACKRPSEINEHLPTLRELARGCRHVTEFGTRAGVSTTAFLHAQPEVLVCYDVQRLPPVDRLERLAGATRFEFRREDVLAADIAETDLLFIDTWHVYGQLKAELERHAAKVRRFIVVHGTEAFRDRGESEGHRGLWPAVEEFLTRGDFRLKQHYPNNNGLTVLERVAPRA